MENFKSFNQRTGEALSSEAVDTEIDNIIESSFVVLKNNLLDNEDKIHELEYRKILLETITEKLGQVLLDEKYENIQTAIDLIDSEIFKLQRD